MRVSSNASVDPRTVGLPFGVGDVIAGKYRVDRVLGAGGMGLVLAGHHVALDQRVAIKVLKPQALDNPEYVTRFGREARAAAKLRGEHVARVLDVGQLDGGLPYMVLEYLHGKDLSQLVKERGTLPVSETADYVLQACEAIAEAHRAGIVHRDIKPANLFVTKRHDGSTIVKVLDFGISKMSKQGEDSGPSENLTQTQTMIGSPHYMSPEQLKSARTVDARTDVWSLGGVLFKLLTGEPAFNGDSTPELCVAILMGEPRSMRELLPDIPEEVERVVLKCLAKDPAHRFQTVGELAAALAPFASADSKQNVDRIGRVASSADPLSVTSEPPPAPSVDEQAGVDVIMTTLTASAATMPSESGLEGSKLTQSVHLPMESSKGRWGIVAGVGVALVLVGALAFTAKRASTPAQPPPAVVTNAPPPPASTTEPPPPPPQPAASPAPPASASVAPVAATTAKTAGPIRPVTPPRATTVAPAKPTASAAPPPPTQTAAPTATTPFVDFGGRK